MKQKKIKETQEEILSKYVVRCYPIEGVPESLLEPMCVELGVSHKKLMKYLCGQTMGLVGKEGIIYSGDIWRFIKGLPNLD